MSPPFIDNLLDRLFEPAPAIKPRRVTLFEPEPPLEAGTQTLAPMPRPAAPAAPPMVQAAFAKPPEALPDAMPPPVSARLATPPAVPPPVQPIVIESVTREAEPARGPSPPVEPATPPIRPRAAQPTTATKDARPPAPPLIAPRTENLITRVVERVSAAPPDKDAAARLAALERAVAALPALPGAKGQRDAQQRTQAAGAIAPRPAPPQATPGPARARPASAREATEPAPDAEPTVRVTIGRIDIRAVGAPSPLRTQPARPPRLGLDEYLRRRDRG